ncbi:MAG: anthranilate phosphoribosyltransferase [Myxococcales bacterium]|nr:anthranilate phosphoribosyltransferase [Myxococcales bacterium]
MARLLKDAPLSEALAQALMDGMMGGAVGEIETAAVLTAMARKGPTVEELVGLARGMRARMVAVTAPGPLLDTCGTGGSGLDTPNISTMAAFVAAAAGVRVAKHGNRASSGRCGSSDLLEAVGVPVAVGAQAAAALLDEANLAFLFAPAYHPAVKAVVPVRRRLGFRTVFNFLGPLCNPAGATRQVLGVSDPAMAPLMAQALLALGSERVLVVHGADGLDELTLTGPTHFWEVAHGHVVEGVIEPADAGLPLHPTERLQGGDVATNRALFQAVLGGEPGPVADLVRLNAGAALWVGGAAEHLRAGVALAGDLLASGAAQVAFETYRAAARRHAAG